MVQVIGESSNEGPAHAKEVIFRKDSAYWCSKKGLGFPQWLTFDIGEGKTLKEVRFRTLNVCNTAPKDMIFYKSTAPNGPWTEISRGTRHNGSGSDWWNHAVDSDEQFLKVEFVNNQNKTNNAEWSSYTYLYEADFVTV